MIMSSEPSKDEDVSLGVTGSHLQEDVASTPSPVTLQKIREAFPGAITNDELISNIQLSLEKHGFGESVLAATSLCCDELSRTLEEDLNKAYDKHFSMGGLAGCAFGGVTAFGAMAHHIPNGGSCIIVYGPHVGVDEDGTVGTVGRRGREKGGACCGSAVAAARYIKDHMEGKCQDFTNSTLAVDAQQVNVCNMLLPYGQRIHSAEDPMVELPYALFEAQEKLLRKIISKASGHVAGDGKIALLGGIQINTPAEMSDYFLPLRFEILNNKGECINTIIETPSRAALRKIQELYPTAMSNNALLDMVTGSLADFGYSKTTTLLATSLCCDEVTRPLEEIFQNAYGQHFRLGGLTGFPSGGVEAFSAMAAHIPDNGSCIIVYGPHVGINSDGAVGSVNPRDHEVSTACCSSAIAASRYVNKVMAGTIPQQSPASSDPLDAQQKLVDNKLLPYGKRLAQAKNLMVELPLALFDAQDRLMMDIAAKAFTSFPSSAKIALLGGIQINTPGSLADHFVPLRFQVLDHQGQEIKDFLGTEVKRIEVEDIPIDTPAGLSDHLLSLPLQVLNYHGKKIFNFLSATAKLKKTRPNDGSGKT